MKSSYSFLAIVSISFLLNACVSKQAILKNQSGHITTCQAQAYGLIPMQQAETMYKECLKAAQESGYSIVQEKDISNEY